jgi:hypothetical protein
MPIFHAVIARDDGESSFANASPVIARSSCDEAIQVSLGLWIASRTGTRIRATRCARNDELNLLRVDILDVAGGAIHADAATEHARVQQLLGWVERSDTHQSQFAKLIGFAKGSTHPTR